MKANSEKVALLSPTDNSVLAYPGLDGQADHVKVRGKWSQLMLGVGDYESAVRALPPAASEQDKLIEFFSGDRDYLNDLSQSEKQSYNDLQG
jgi:hypothetical protein